MKEIGFLSVYLWVNLASSRDGSLRRENLEKIKCQVVCYHWDV
ncbi:hypothetical protein J14TS2_39340 [Bacillus sp. J14TS2]|nr:hypothetical protein J14TS2_39340 [Bacillus sp. J14TS2]